MKFDVPMKESEWQAQRCAFDGDAGGDDDKLVARYKAIARGLRVLPSVSLPTDFARRVAEAAHRQDAVLGTFERIVLTAFCLMFVVGLLVASALSFSSEKTLSIGGLPWLFAALIFAAVAGMAAQLVTPRRFS